MAEIEAEALTQTEAREEVEGGVLNRQPHKLERKWTFWFDNQSKVKQGAAWGSSLRKVYTFDTVEDFWWSVICSPLSRQIISVLALHALSFTFHSNFIFFTWFVFCDVFCNRLLLV
ncbi:Eukaryotic translation initiation factor isoform 4E [Dendrobium catenatum]|uniref:mRNA cap-binding protein n=1 Tax=Dendrobium catenatum TaxID=906689 RepID=A0A2I0WA53_9ASPA|nr:Eukaryotic translation initiation factor isoform 4E [Dendrobium catenatum]